MLSGGAMFAVGEAIVKTLSRDHAIAQIVWARYTFHAVVFLAVFGIGLVSVATYIENRYCKW